MNRIRYDTDCLPSTHCLFSCLGEVFTGRLYYSTKRSEEGCPITSLVLHAIALKPFTHLKNAAAEERWYIACLFTLCICTCQYQCVWQACPKMCPFSDLYLPLRVRTELISYRSAFVRNTDKQISIPISHRVCVQANTQNDKKYVNLYVNASALGTQASRLLQQLVTKAELLQGRSPLTERNNFFLPVEKMIWNMC